MALGSRLASLIRNIVGRRQQEQDLDDEVLSTFDQSWEDAPGSADTDWEDLSAPELRSLLRSLEG